MKLTKEAYQNKKLAMLSAQIPPRECCERCLQPRLACYCDKIQSFDPKIEFVILIHPIEVRRRIATGRMAHLCLQGSHLISGEDFTENSRVNELLGDNLEAHSVILYPGSQALNISAESFVDRQEKLRSCKKLRIFVIDGTWATAKKMLRKSKNLAALPQICFSPRQASRFRVRKQPQENCLSTIEAIHECIELLVAPGEIQSASARPHDNLLEVFDQLVTHQLNFVRHSYATSGKDPLSRDKKRGLV